MNQIREHQQSGITWKEDTLWWHLQHRIVSTSRTPAQHWFIVGEKKDGSVFSKRISKETAKILLETGVAFGN